MTAHDSNRVGPAVRDPRGRRVDRRSLADRWDSLVLFTPRRYSSLAGLRVSRRPGRLSHPRRGDRLPRAVRGAFELPVELEQPGAVADERGRRVRPRARDRRSRPTRSSSPPGRSRSRTCRRSPASSRPRCSRRTAPATAPERRPRGTVLVVGGGNTGFQIAKELSATHEVHLAVGSRQTPLPQRFLGRDLFWWLTKTG